MVIYEKIINARDCWTAHYHGNNLRPNVVLLGQETWLELQKESAKVGGFTTPERPKFQDMEIEVVNKKDHISVGLRLVFAENGVIYGTANADMKKWMGAF